MGKPLIVVSGINIFEAGPLAVYKDLLEALIKANRDKEYDIKAFVHKAKLFEEYSGDIDITEIPQSRKSYLHRMYYELCYFKKYSKKNAVDIWINIHDMTSNGEAEKVFTYCHNATPFYKPGYLDYRYRFMICLFAWFYKFLYKINIHKTRVIVQQQWMRKEFERKFGIKDVIVSYPNLPDIQIPRKLSSNEKYTFIFASYPRTFKNFEAIIKACEILNNEGYTYRVQITLDGSENKYSAYLLKKYGAVKNIEWIGLQQRNKLFELYSKSNCMIFPSRLETWGLPITEYKKTGNPMILADLPYAHETVGNYDKVCFFNTRSAQNLADKMKKAITGEAFYSETISKEPDEPFAENWEELIELMLKSGSH